MVTVLFFMAFLASFCSVLSSLDTVKPSYFVFLKFLMLCLNFFLLLLCLPLKASQKPYSNWVWSNAGSSSLQSVSCEWNGTATCIARFYNTWRFNCLHV